MQLRTLYLIIILFVFTSIKSPIRFPEVHFEKGSITYLKKNFDKPRKRTKKIIKEMVKVLENNPKIELMRIRGHINYLEKDSILGMLRANQVIEDLVSKGISRTRLTATNAYAEHPLIDPQTIKKFKKNEEVEFAHSLNRRVEFSIAKYDH